MPLKRQSSPVQPPLDPPEEIHTGDSGGGGLIGALYSQPVMLSMPKPLYPRSARERGVEGKVRVKVWVNHDGSVERAEVVKGSGYELLDRAAHESALEARFKPGLKAGVPVAAEKTMVVSFSLVE
jgi:protein TonB